MGRARLFVGLVAVNAFLIACTGSDLRPTPPTVPPSQPSSSCTATNAQFAIGSAASPEVLERARVAAHAASARFLRPNQPITMEFLGSRLNLNLTEQDVVHSAYCG